MKRRRPTLKDFFNFTRNDRIGILQLSVLLLLVLAFPHFYAVFVQRPSITTTVDKEQLQLATRQIYAAQATEEAERRSKYNHYNNKQFANKDSKDSEEDDSDFENTTEVQPYPFNPNNLNYKMARELGMPQRVAYTIENYLEKGGQFRYAEDMQKIYGLSKNDYERLLPYIQLPHKTTTTQTSKEQQPSATIADNSSANTSQTPANTNKLTTFGFKDSSSFEPKRSYKSNTAMIDMNTADSLEWQQIRGVGKGYANRIIKYRNLLGGYTAKEQLKEVYGMTDELYAQIEPHLLVPHPSKVKKININKATFEELNAQAYIRKYKLANTIIKYREQHGAYQTVKDLQQIQIITPEMFAKINLYLIAQ